MKDVDVKARPSRLIGVIVAVVVATLPVLGAVPSAGSAPIPPCPPGTQPIAPTATSRPPCVLPWLPGWRPQLGVVFNDPLGTTAQATAIVRRVNQAIWHTPKGETIKIAVYSFDRPEVARALLQARKRGVKVQIVVKALSSVGRSVQRVLGKKPTNQNFLIACAGRCRDAGTGGNMHNKVFSFSRTGGARALVIVSSGNLTGKAVRRQWNDSYAIARDVGLYDAWSRMFDQLKVQKRTGPRTTTYVAGSGGYQAAFSRVQRYRPDLDPVVQRLRKVGCKAPAGYGSNGRTVVRITMYAMFKTRGNTIAQQMARLQRAGCDVRAIMSVAGGDTVAILQKAGIPVRAADWEFTERDPELEDGIGGFGPRFYSHFKVMAVSGRYEGRGTATVWTGSENWDGLSFFNEEVVLQVNDRAVYRRYKDRFARMWNGRATHVVGIEPTYGP